MVENAEIGFKENIKARHNDESQGNVFITYKVSADDVIQLPSSVQLNEADHSIRVSVTEEAQTFSTNVVQVVLYDADETWPCNRCNQVFPTSLALASHKYSEHVQAETNDHKGMPELYVCNVCNVAYQEKEEIEKHKKMHEIEFQNWPCSQCDQVFSSKISLGAHRNAQHGEIEYEKPTFTYDEVQELYICDICSAEYQNQTEVEKHLITHDNKFKCSVCDEKFEKVYHLGTHSVIHYDDKMFRCPLCKYKTSNKVTFCTHINNFHSKNPRYMCKLCGKGFLDPVVHKEHKNVHLGVKPFICVVCKKAFAFSKYLICHQTRLHRVDTKSRYTNKCTMCKAAFRTPSELKKHVQNVHEKKYKELKYLCDICGKLFLTQVHLTAHYRLHTGDRPFSCTHCNKSFIQKGNLVSHERVHSREKPFVQP